MFSVLSHVRFAWLFAGACMVSMGCAYAQDSVTDPAIYCDGEWCGYNLSEDDEGGVYPSSHFSYNLEGEDADGVFFVPTFDAKDAKEEVSGPQFSELYYFFSRAGSVNLGIVLSGLADYLSHWSGGACDFVLPARLMALLANYGYVSARMMENVALQDKASIADVSETNWVALSRLSVYIFKTLELGVAYAGSMYALHGDVVADPGVAYQSYKAIVPWVGLWLAAYDLQTKIEQLTALESPVTEKEKAVYRKAESGVVIYGIKMLATAMPFVLTTPAWQDRARLMSFVAALGFLYEGLAASNK